MHAKARLYLASLHDLKAIAQIVNVVCSPEWERCYLLKICTLKKPPSSLALQRLKASSACRGHTTPIGIGIVRYPTIPLNETGTAATKRQDGTLRLYFHCTIEKQFVNRYLTEMFCLSLSKRLDYLNTVPISSLMRIACPLIASGQTASP